jgi:hypothetical protein
MFDPDAGMPRFDRSLNYLGACIIAGLRLAREKQFNVRVIPTSHAIDESVDMAHEILNRVFRTACHRLSKKGLIMNEGLDVDEEELEAGEFAAAELVEHVKRMKAVDVELRVVDESGLWLVTVQRIGASSGSGKPN